MKINILSIVIFLLCVSCKDQNNNQSRVDVLPYYNEATFTPHWIDPKDESLDTFHQISDFSLINQEGKTITNETFKNKIYVVDFFFTICPGICPKMMSNMMEIQDKFIDDNNIMLLSHTVTPEQDSVPVLKEYAEERGILSDKWHLVTGSQEEIYRLGRNDYFVEEDLGIEKNMDDFLHTENFVLIDKERHIRGIYNGLSKTSIKQLINDINTLKSEK